MTGAAALPIRALSRVRAAVGIVLACTLLAGSTGQVAPAASAAAKELTENVSVIVQKASALDNSVEEAVLGLGGKITKDLWIVDGFAADIPKAAVGLVQSLPGVRVVSPNVPMRLQGFYGEGSGGASAVYPDVVRAPKLWSSGITGQGVGVAVIDTGVDTSGDLAGRVSAAVDFTYEQDNRDNYGHGTFIAGLIAGSGTASSGSVKGVAPNANIVSIKIAGRDGGTDVLMVLAGLQWAVMNKATHNIRVLNLSLGTDGTQSYRVDPLNLAVERVWQSGVVVVTSAGNQGPGSTTIAKPGDDPWVITVGSVDDRTTVARSDDTVPSFSSRGPTVDGVTKPDVVASGKSVVSVRAPGSAIDNAHPEARITVNGNQAYFKGSGTSFSTAVASGSAALMLHRHPNLNPNQVKKRLMVTAKDGASTDPNVVGSGIIDAFAAANNANFTEANRGLYTSTGQGTLQASRGSWCIRLENADGTLGDCMTEADALAKVPFNKAEYFDGTQWAGTQWANVYWDGTQWAGTRWNGTQWANVYWDGTQWAGTQWAGAEWTGTQWAGTQWAGTQWAGTQWAGTQWAGTQWAGTQWAGTQWAGVYWDGTQWAGTQWAGTQWAGTQWGGTQWGGTQWASADPAPPPENKSLFLFYCGLVLDSVSCENLYNYLVAQFAQFVAKIDTIARDHWGTLSWSGSQWS